MMNRMHDDRQKTWEEEREQARACGCTSCREKYGLEPEPDHDTGTGWAILAGIALGAVAMWVIGSKDRQQAA